MEQQKPFYKILNEICNEQNIKQKMLSYGWIRELQKENQKHYIIRYQFDLNSSISYKIAKDKFATYEILKSNNVPTIEHKMIFNPATRSEYYENKFIEEAKEILLKNNNKLVIKANDSSEGKDVYLCTNEKEIEEVINRLFEEKNNTLSACPYLDIKLEYRAVFLCGEIIYIYKKRKPYVTGNGKNTISELIEIKEKEYNIKFDLIKNINFEYIPKNNEEIVISWKHNLSNGAEPCIIDDEDKYISEIKEIAVNAGKAININFANIDIALTTDNKIYVMEINGNVCMNKFTEKITNGYNIAKDIYSKAINKMFESKNF